MTKKFSDRDWRIKQFQIEEQQGGRNSGAKEGDEKVFAGWILHMFISGQLKEYTPRGGMTACLKIKRKIMRSQGRGHGVRWECKKGKLRLRHYDGGVDGMKWLPVEHLGDE